MGEKDVYQKLAAFLDDLPAGFPSTPSGVELRILRRLFTPEEAELALHLTLLPEEVRVIAMRARLELETAAEMLDRMERKGLIAGRVRHGRPASYAIQQFAVGFWEGQVNRLDRGLAEDVHEYLKTYANAETWGKAPQLRTIPVGESIPNPAEVMPHERAEDLVRAHHTLAVANCICRQEMEILDQGCKKPRETCLIMGTAADSYIRTGKGRPITQDEALALLRLAEKSALVLQASNAQKAASICMCCGCCCAILRTLKQHPEPGKLVSSPYRAFLDIDSCNGCGVCEDRCQMDAVLLGDEGKAILHQDRCIGCGLCISTCPTEALTLQRKPASEQAAVPKDITQTYIQLAQVRGKLGPGKMLSIALHSGVDRIRAPK